MTSFYWICLLVGGGVVVLQLIAATIGLDHDAPHDLAGHGGASEGLHLFSVRSLSAGIAFFGLGGIAGMRLGLAGAFSVIPGALLGVVAAFVMALLLRGMRQFESDRSFQLSAAVGQSGDVYLGIPAQRQGVGKIHINVQERLMELDAMTPDGEIPTGSRVLVIDTVAPATVIVVTQPRILEEGNA